MEPPNCGFWGNAKLFDLALKVETQSPKIAGSNAEISGSNIEVSFSNIKIFFSSLLMLGSVVSSQGVTFFVVIYF